jgi:ribosome-binding factor A
MAKRSARVNELIKRVLSEILRSDFQTEAVLITIIDVDVSPDLRTGKVFYSVLGGSHEEWQAERFFHRRGKLLQGKIFREVTLKYTPQLDFVFDNSQARGTELLQFMDDLTEDAEPGDDTSADADAREPS